MRQGLLTCINRLRPDAFQNGSQTGNHRVRGMLPVLVTGTVGAFSGRQDSQFAVVLVDTRSRAVRLRFIPPQLPSLTEHPPEGADWIHEVKHDGYRTMLV